MPYSNFLDESFLTIFHHCVFAFRDPPKCQQDLELLSKPILQEKKMVYVLLAENLKRTLFNAHSATSHLS